MTSLELLPAAQAISSHIGDLRLEVLTQNHLDNILSLEKQSHPHPWSRENFLSSLNSSHHCWGLWQDEVLMGHVYFSLAVGEAELLLLVIAKSAQGKGLARLLLSEAIKRVKPYARQFFLEVRASNHGAIALYENLGFNQIGERRHYYPGKNGGEDALVFGLELTEDFFAPE